MMNERDIDRSSPGNVSFLGINNLTGGPSPSDWEAAASGSGDEFKVLTDLDGRVSVHREADGSRSSRDAETEEAADAEDRSSYEVVASDGVRVPHVLLGFNLGDMVWGKVKSHPWWPGHIFHEAFAMPAVRRAKREGHFLVAFFGDSSYGWFHPTELLPFAPHFDEKSKQTTMRNFVRAVDEAIDETSRREALGLTCFCRNKTNFRPARVPGHFHVDVPGFEPGGVYSSEQIDDARDRFEPRNVLSFVQQAALDPMPCESSGLDRIKSMATLLAYRRAVFEEFDETYAQAFGVEPVRPSANSNGIPDQPERFAPRATPLSGKLVIPESPRPRKVSAAKLTGGKAPKVPSAKKNKYVLKRRDEARGGDPPGVAASPPSSLPDFVSPYSSYHNVAPSQQQHLQQQDVHYVAARDALPPAKAGPVSSQVDLNVLQKRPLPVPVAKEEQQQPVWDDNKGEAPRAKLQQLELGDAGSAVARAARVPEDGKQLKMEPWMVEAENLPGGANSLNIITPAAQAIVDSKDGVRMEAVQSAIADGKMELPRSAAVGTVKKEKIRKRRLEDAAGFVGGPEETGEIKKKKKKKKVSSVESGGGADHLTTKGNDTYGKLAGQSILKATEHQRNANNAVKSDEVDLTTQNVDLRLIVGDIQELAVHHSYGAERHADAVALQVVRKYRSLVYQKGLVLQPLGDPDAPELRPAKVKELAAARTIQESEASRGGGGGGGVALSKKQAIPKSDDPTKAGRKRNLLDRQQEISPKRAKKLEKIKSLSGEKKTAIGLKTAAVAAEALQRNQKDKEPSPAAASTTLKGKPAISSRASEGKPAISSRALEGRPAISKQQEQTPLLPKTPSPTSLVMKFPARSTLPSVSSLKARFARFGPLDHSAIRVFWKSYTCKVVFKFKTDAEAAFNYVNSNTDLFGQIKVTYYLKEVDAPGLDPPTPSELGKQVPELRPAVDALQGGATVSFGPPKPVLGRPPSSQLKSILKKSGEDGGIARETSRGVRFMLEESKVGVKTSDSSGVDGALSSYAPPLEPPLLIRNQKPPGLVPPPAVVPFRPAPSNHLAMLQNQRLPPPPPPPPPSLLGPPPSISLPPRPRPLPPPQLHVPDAQLPLPPPPRTAGDAPSPHVRHGDLLPQPRAQHNGADGSRRNVAPDISEQLLELLFRCREVVNNVRDALGYLPYHPI